MQQLAAPGPIHGHAQQMWPRTSTTMRALPCICLQRAFGSHNDIADFDIDRFDPVTSLRT